ncbi:MAG: hypothetical protein IJ173_02125 [Kiritimatiellae bacterium]|nr:hypothetical protein [Kiritimatiellia bacterium]
MQTSLTIDTDAGTLDALRKAIDARSKFLGVTTADSCIAAGIQVLRSLKAATKSANPKSVDALDFKIKETELYGGFTGRRKICARVGSHYGPRSHIRPAMGFNASVGGVLTARVYAIYTTNPNDRFKRNVNAPALCWYVLCQHRGQAEAYAVNHIARIKRKEGGMAKYTLGIAQAQLSTHAGRLKTPAEAAGRGGLSARAIQLAYEAARLRVEKMGAGEGSIDIEFLDELRYSQAAAGGGDTLSRATLKAAASMLAYVRKQCGLPLNQNPIPQP